MTRINTLFEQMMNLMSFKSTIKSLTPSSIQSMQANVEDLGSDDPELKKSIDAIIGIAAFSEENNRDGSLSDQIDEEIAQMWNEIHGILSRQKT